jgi:hypothetical protein
MPSGKPFSVNLLEGRESGESTWLLPPWGHPLGLSVYPLFIEIGGRVWPVGTAFNTGGGVNITLTAFHCVEEAIKHEPLLHEALTSTGIAEGAVLSRCGLYILRNHRTEAGVRFHFIPLEHISGGPPADVVFCASQFVHGAASAGSKLSFALPEPDGLVHSVGYSAATFPSEGVPLDRLTQFDWANDYSHEFRVIEGRIQHLFLRQYAAGYLRGPCFTFTGSLQGGMSGGPVFDLKRGVIFGVNSATAFDDNTSLGSLLYPYVLNPITFGARIGGSLNLKATYRIVDMLEFGSISSDGTHSELAYKNLGAGIGVSMPIPVSYRGRVFEDLSGLQAGHAPAKFEGDLYFRRRVKSPDDQA